MHTDANEDGVGAILLQKQKNGDFEPVMYYSQRTTPEQSKYHSYKLETLAIVLALTRMRCYLQGIEFKVITDCAALKYTLKK